MKNLSSLTIAGLTLFQTSLSWAVCCPSFDATDPARYEKGDAWCRSRNLAPFAYMGVNCPAETEENESPTTKPDLGYDPWSPSLRCLHRSVETYDDAKLLRKLGCYPISGDRIVQYEECIRQFGPGFDAYRGDNCRLKAGTRFENGKFLNLNYPDDKNSNLSLEEIFTPLELLEPKVHFSASSKQVRLSNRNRPRVWDLKGEIPTQSTEQLLQNLNHSLMGTETWVSAQTINGIRLTNESLGWAAVLKKLTTVADPILQQVTQDESGRKWMKENQVVQNELDLSVIPDGCDKALCAIQALFGETVGIKLAYLLNRHGVNGSHISWFNSIPWQDNEKLLDIVLFTYDDFPVGFFKKFKDQNRRMILHRTGSWYPGFGHSERPIATPTILYSRWQYDTDPAFQVYALFHELGHQVGAEYWSGSQSNWWDVSVFSMKNQHSYSCSSEDAEKRLPSYYGGTSAGEEMAESVTAYRYYPQSLKVRDPKKYDLIRDIFQGIEY